jgi:hypothetical protein
MDKVTRYLLDDDYIEAGLDDNLIFTLRMGTKEGEDEDRCVYLDKITAIEILEDMLKIANQKDK